MPWSDPTTRSSGYTVTATNWNELVNNFLFLAEVGRTAFTANVTISATTVGTANQIVSLGALTYEAVPTLIEFYCPRYAAAAGVTNLIIRDGTTVIGTLTQYPASTNQGGLFHSFPVTPTAASHTYNVAAWVASGSGTMQAGTGGAAGDASTLINGFIRATRIPT
jgi:hypothetical protein